MILSLDKFYAAVLGATFFGAIVSYWLVTTLSYSLEVKFIYTQLDEFIDDGLGTLLGQGVVYFVTALIVAMALNLKADRWVSLHVCSHLLYLSH